MTHQRLRLILPSHAYFSRKTLKEKHYLLRRWGIDSTDLLTAALTFWEYPDMGRFETNPVILDFFREFIEDEISYAQAQLIASVIQRVLQDIQACLGNCLKAYLEAAFEGVPVRLKLERFLESDIMLAITNNENLNENPSPLENHSLDR